ncbi:MAG: hypothetical protein AAF203_10540, partial [Pseudomonadota bacterium]
WYKVESESETKKTQKKSTYEFDSVEPSRGRRKFRPMPLWTLTPKLQLGGGFHADNELFEKSYADKFFGLVGLKFRNRPTNRLSTQALFIVNNSLLLNASYEFTPSRKQNRNYYGVGVSHLLVSDKEFANLVEFDNYFVTGTYGYESLFSDGRGYWFEVRGYLGDSRYAVQIQVGYIIPI